MEISHRAVARMFVSLLEAMTQEEATEAIEIVAEEIEKKRPGLVRVVADHVYYAAPFADMCFEDWEVE